MEVMFGPAANIFITDEWRQTTVLARMFRFHTIILPGLLVLLIVPHLLLVKRHKQSAIPVRGEEECEAGPQTTFLKHQRKSAGYAILFVAIIALLALALAVSIGGQVMEGLEVTLPPWFFWWEHALGNWRGLAAFQRGTISMVLALLAVPFIDRYRGHHPLDRPLIILGGVLIMAYVVGLTLFVWLSPSHHHVGL